MVFSNSKGFDFVENITEKWGERGWGWGWVECVQTDSKKTCFSLTLIIIISSKIKLNTFAVHSVSNDSLSFASKIYCKLLKSVCIFLCYCTSITWQNTEKILKCHGAGLNLQNQKKQNIINNNGSNKNGNTTVPQQVWSNQHHL